MRQKIKLRIFLLSLGVLLLGCGASTGTGQDSITSSSQQRNLSVDEILAVDDIIVGGSVTIGTSLDPVSGALANPIPFQALETGNDGKTIPFSISLSQALSTIFVQVSGGREGAGGPQLDAQTRFTGLLDLVPGSSTVQAKRINITPFTSLIASAKSRSPQISTTNLVSEALNQFLQSSGGGTLNFNSQSYQGLTTAQGEPEGNAAVLQMMNEMIRIAANSSAGALPADRVSSFLRHTTGPADAGVFFEGSPVFREISLVAANLSANTTTYGEFFSSALSKFSTDSELSFKPSGFLSRPLGSNFVQISSSLQIDSTTVEIKRVIGAVAYVEASQGGVAVLTAVPDRIRMDLRSNLYESNLQTNLFLRVEKSTDNLLEVLIDPVELLTTLPAEIRFPSGAEITGRRVQPNGNIIQVTIQNESEDRFSSETDYLDLDLKTLRMKAEDAAGSALPSLEGDTFEVEIRFGKGILFLADGFGSTFSSIVVSSATVISP
jgi:hypothetical protein